MFEAVRKNKRVAQIILGLIIIPFAFFGLDAFFATDPNRQELASVGGVPITAAEFSNALRMQQDRLRQVAGAEFDSSITQTPAFRQQVLDALINQHLLARFAEEHRLTVSADQLREAILQIPAFHMNGQFSPDAYQMGVRNLGLTATMFEQQLAQDLRLRQITEGIGDSALVAGPTVHQTLIAQLQSRTVATLAFPTANYSAQVTVSDDDIKRYYDENGAQFERAPRVKAQYVILDQKALSGGEEVSEADARQFYQNNLVRYGRAEERSARHILLELAPNASDEEVAKVTEKANALVAELRANPASFAEVAQRESQDPGSAPRGGDLGFFSASTMTEAFSKAAFGMEKGQISEPVRSEYGLHIIQLEDIRPADVRPFEEVRSEIEGEIRRQIGERRYTEVATEFANMLYEQSDSLQPVAERFKLEIKESDWIDARNGDIEGFRNTQLIEGLFAPEAAEEQHNLGAIEIEHGRMLGARVQTFEPAHRLPLEEVRDRVREALVLQGAAKLAREAGEAALARVRNGENIATDTQTWSAPAELTRGTATREQQGVFALSAATLPAYTGGASADGGYLIYRLDKVTHPTVEDKDPREEIIRGEYQRMLGQRDFAAFLASLRGRYKVEVQAAALAAFNPMY